MDSEEHPLGAVVRRLRCSPVEAFAVAVLAAGALAALGLLWLLASRGDRTTVVPAGLVVESAPPSAAPSELVVHVAGRVAAPGVLRLPGGSRVGDAIAAAGGALGDAALEQLNLARQLADGEQVLVPGPGVPPPAAVAGAAASGLLDLNLATAEDLDELPGVGPVLAERILAHREAIGRFSSVEELRDVEGIGDATFRDLAPAVTV